MRKRLQKQLVLFTLLVGLIGLVVFAFWRSKNHYFHARSDQIVDIYNPPGAATPSAVPHQAKLVVKTTGQKVHVPILLYHYVEVNRDLKDTTRTKLSVTPYWFEKQLQFLKDNGYTAITFGQLYEAISHLAPLPPRPVILTFDDGYRDFYTDAWPLLKKYQVKATTFVVADFLDKPNYMSTWQLAEIATDSAQLVTIGSHTLHHVALTAASKDKDIAEITQSKAVLEKEFHQPVTVFAYPYGSFNKDVVAKVKEAGYLMAASTLFGATEFSDNLFVLPRIRIGNYAGKFFADRLATP